MTLFGLYVRDLSKSDWVWFSTDQSIAVGSYCLGVNRKSANVFVAKSIPALILQVGPIIDEAEARAQSLLSPTGTSATVEKQLAAEMTRGLMERLNETSSIWESNPKWLNRLQPFTNDPTDNSV